ncbi:MAG TPA: THUMP domain-containing protein [Candidatus Thermoplasmatota archaeon]|nr:THUMP domain-containing protein [Candidatus Thermoplasmatota archaeon]
MPNQTAPSTPATGAAAGPRIDGVLVRFGEIGIKSPPVRRQMLERLRLNLLDQMLRASVEGDAKTMGSRLWLVGPKPAGLAQVACRTFGVVSVSPCQVVHADLDAIGAAAAVFALDRPWTTFAVRATREGTHAFSSHEVQVSVGSAVWKAAEAAGRTPKVDLDQPDFEVFIDIRGERAYLFTDRLDGPGGIPVGSQGTVVACLSDEASFVAAWLLMRRGCSLVPVHAGTTGSLDMDAVATLASWGMPAEVHLFPVCSGSVSKATLLQAAGRVALERGLPAIATGDTLDSALGTPRLPVLRPLCGLLPAERERWRKWMGLGPVVHESILDPASAETVDTVMAMRRTVEP